MRTASLDLDSARWGAPLGDTMSATPSPQRQAERMLDRIIRFRPGESARLWREHRPGFKTACTRCGHVGRTWVGTYYQFFAKLLGYSIHRCEPRCVECVIVTEKLEADLDINRPHDWRVGREVQT